MPILLQWIGFIIAVVGLLMATPSIIQFIWGRAKLSSSFVINTIDQITILSLLIKNVPIKNSVLGRILEDRTVINKLVVTFEILTKSNEKIGNTTRGKIGELYSGYTKTYKELSTDSDPIFVPIVSFDKKNNMALIMSDSRHSQLQLELHSLYTVKIQICFGHRKKYILQNFAINNNIILLKDNWS